ncbi:hypothetical protein HanHA89_Chr17g0724811 [Helianthus annuus]|nr:hypothetical protein HanHA89_Chr17g0724811 [Helianthus annuus]
MVAGFMNFSNQATLGCGSPATTWGSGDEPGALVKTVSLNFTFRYVLFIYIPVVYGGMIFFGSVSFYFTVD